MLEANVIYLRPNGIDLGTCLRDAPCKRVQFGASKTTATRNHIVLDAGLYDLDYDSEYITPSNTPAQRLFIHGGGSAIRSATDSSAFTTNVNAVIRDLEIIGNGTGIYVYTTGQSVLERVKIRGSNTVGAAIGGAVLMRDVSIEDAGIAVYLGVAARLTLDRGVFKNPGTGIFSNTTGAIVDISNLLVFGATGLAFDLASSAGGVVRFTTIADSGTDSGSGPRAFRCGTSGPTIQSSIIWAPGTVSRPAIDGGCPLVSSIVGPTAVPGATNVDPLFVDARNRDYHLSPGSPARDMVDTGPTTDFERDPRPRGARFDIGADEAQ